MAISNIPHLVSVTRAFNILKIRTLSLVTIERWNEQANHEAEESRPSSTQGRGEASSRVWQMLPGATLLRCLATSGCDRVMLDLEHGNIDGNRALIHEANKTP